jgi:glycosyltransferase involved in cell wall biosynthesis
MRILYVTAHYPPDFTSGATLQVRRLARHVAELGHDVRVLSGAIAAGLADGELRDEVVDGTSVRWIGTADRIEQGNDANWLNAAATEATATLLVEFQPDIVHAHALQTLGAGPLDAAAAQGVPTIVTMHDFWWWCPRLFLVDRELRPCPLDTRASDCACARTTAWRHERARRLADTLQRVDCVLVPSNLMRDAVIANGLAPGRVDVDENDVDGASMAPAPSNPDGDVRFLYVGGDSPLKGRDVLLAAADQLRPADGWSVRLYGATEPARRWWRRPDRRVRFLDAYDPAEAAVVYAGADVTVIPSVARESFSIAAREALGCGLAVIASDCLGPTEVVIDGENGLVVPIGDAGALAAAMRSLIEDRALLARLRAGARSTSTRLRDPAEHAASLLRRYAGLRASST